MPQSNQALTTDLYELTMAAAYFETGLRQRAVFDLFVRSLPPCREYLVVAGLEQALDYLSNVRFSSSEIDYLRDLPAFSSVSREFFDYLSEFRFTGDAWAMREGTAAFGMEPILRIEAPLIEAQIVETFLLATINVQTLVASKAARLVRAAQGRPIVDFGSRRAHGPEAGVLAARGAYIGGCAGTSNAEAGRRFEIPVFGTLAHSFVMSFETEDEAFRAFLKVFPRTATILLDTYDTIGAARKLARDFGPGIRAVRLDSGDLLELSLQVRDILDNAGMQDTQIFATGDLDEYKIDELLGRGAPIDSFGVGTQLATSFDWPALPVVYKLAGLVDDAGSIPKMKLSPEKETYPGLKQVWRFQNIRGDYLGDIIATDEEREPAEAVHLFGARSTGKPLLVQVMSKGVIVDPNAQTLNEARTRAADEMKRLNDTLRIHRAEPADLAGESSAEGPYPVRFSRELTDARDSLMCSVAG